MAKRTDNIITRGHTGRFGEFVFTSNDIIRTRPDFSKRVFSPAQVAHLTQWEQAKAFGRMAIRDPGLNSYYGRKAEKQKGLGAWHMAIKNYFELPGIRSIYIGTRWNYPGVTLQITSNGIFKLRELKITFSKPDGSILEEGPANLPEGEKYWYYPMQNEISAARGNQITFRGCSLPGHTIEKVFTICERIPFQSIIDGYSNHRVGKNGKQKSQLRID